MIARLVARRMLRSGIGWGYVFGAYVAASALGYVSTYKTPAERAQLATTFGANAGINALIGPGRGIDTVAGFVAWRCVGVLSLVGAVWGLLAGTRVLRGEEDAGRWELLLAGPTTRRRAAALAVGGLASSVVVLWAVTAVISTVVGRSSKVGIGAGPAAYLALTLASGAGLFLLVGAAASQLAPTRRQAAAWAGGFLGACYALRMVADSGAGLSFLRWAGPLGWIEELRPLAHPEPLALVPLVGAAGGLAVLTVALAGRRDLGAASLPDHATAPPRLALVGGPDGLAVRLARPVLAGWMLGVGALALIMGFVAKAAGEALRDSSSFERVISRLGARGAGASAYLGVGFVVVGVLVALAVAGQLSAARAEEAEGRLEHLLVRPVPRVRWLAGRLAVAAAGVLACSLVAALATWLGAETQSTGLGVVHLVGAGLNLVAPAMVVLGAGTLALGWAPRAVPLVAYGVLGWSFLVQMVGGVIQANHWLLDTSVFHHMTAAPAVAPNWVTAGALLGVAAAATLVGAWRFSRRDLVGS